MSPYNTAEREEYEAWVPIPGFEGQYLISELGRIKSLCQLGYRRKQIRTHGFIDRHGYAGIDLHKEGRKYRWFVHRLVLLAFCGPSMQEINHEDGNPLNNKRSNLSYVTSHDNKVHAYRMGLSKKGPGTHGAKGEAHHNCKLSDDQVRSIRSIKGHLSQSQIANMFGIGQAHVSRILRDECRNH